MNIEKVITRFAPSPTGLLHAGNYRTAVFAYLFAKKTGGQFIVRIEDTDAARSKKEYEENIFEALEWLTLIPDAKYRQSEHQQRHTEELQRLIENGTAYVSKETVTEEGQRAEVIRFKNPNTNITFADAIRGEITFDTTDLGDFVIARSVTEPVFHFAVVVDDADEHVTHVVRGEDHISNTPRQILIQQALGYSTPIYAHLPLVIGADKAKLSKRRGAKALTQYRDEGFLPEAMINYLTLLGWHPEGEREVFSIEELSDIFDLARIQKSPGTFDEVKLRWFNAEHLKNLSDEEFAGRFKDFSNKEIPIQLVSLIKNRARTLREAVEIFESGEFDFMGDSISYEPALLLQNGKLEKNTVKNHLAKISEIISTLSDSSEVFTAERVKELVFPYATEQGRGAVLWPLRLALSGREKSPDPFTIAGLIGKEKTLERIKDALDRLD